jgi:hypothetical protein
MPSPQRTAPKGQKRCSLMLPSGKRCALLFAATDDHEDCPQHRLCSETSTCELCSTWTRDQWDAFYGRRTYAGKKEKSRARSLSSASAVVPSRQPSNLPSTSQAHSPEMSEHHGHREHSHHSSAKKHKKKKRKHHRHRSSGGASHRHRTSKSRTPGSGHSGLSDASGLSAHTGHSGHLSPDGQTGHQSGLPSPDTLHPDPDIILNTLDPDTTGHSGQNVVPGHSGPIGPPGSVTECSPTASPVPRTDSAPHSVTMSPHTGGATDTVQKPTDTLHSDPTQLFPAGNQPQVHDSAEEAPVSHNPTGTNRDKHSPRVRTRSAPPDVPVVTNEQLRELLQNLLVPGTAAPSSRTTAWVDESRPPRRSRRKRPRSSSSSSSSSSRASSRSRDPRSRRRSRQRDPTPLPKEQSPRRARSPKRKAPAAKRRTPSPFVPRDRDGGRVPTSQLSPRTAYRQSQQGKAYYRPDHDQNKQFYDRDLQQRDGARAYEASAKARDREARDAREQHARQTAAQAKPTSRRRSRSRSRSGSSSRERHPSRFSDPDHESRGSDEHVYEGAESQEEVDSPCHDGGSHSLKERLELVRTIYGSHSTILENPAGVIERKSCLGEGSKDMNPRTIPSLPWHPLRQTLVADDMAKVLGKAPAKGRKPATFGPGRYLTRPSQRRSAYMVTGDPPLSAAPVPPDFHLLQPKGSATEHVPVRLSATEAEEWESSLRQSTAIASHQDWYLGAVRTILEGITVDDPGQIPTQIDQALSLLKSGAHAGMDLQSMQHTALHNVQLRRRDAFLNTTVKELTPVMRRSLRQHALDSPTLFDNAACTQASKQIIKSGTLSKVTGSGSGYHKPTPTPPAAAARPKAAPKPKPWSPAPKAPYQPPPKPSPPRGKASPRGTSSRGRGGAVVGGDNQLTTDNHLITTHLSSQVQTYQSPQAQTRQFLPYLVTSHQRGEQAELDRL